MNIFDENLISLTILAATPLVFAAMGELISERAGVFNIGLEGMMLLGAFFGYWGAQEFGSLWLGVLIGALAGMGLAAVMALATIEARADQIVVGIALILVASGLTAFLFKTVFSTREEVFFTPMSSVAIPGLKEIPVIGRPLFDQPPLVYLAFALVPTVWVLLHRTRWGLAIRAAGDLPDAAETAGLSVRRIRWLAILCAGLGAGLGGAFLTLGEVGAFINDMSAGRGFLALSAVIFGAWRPFGALAGCLVFGFAGAINLRLQGQPVVPREVWIAVAVLVLVYVLVTWRGWRPGIDIGLGQSAGIALAMAAIAGAVVLATVEPVFSLPSQAWVALPFVVTIIAVATLGKRAAAPRYLGIPYARPGET